MRMSSVIRVDKFIQDASDQKNDPWGMNSYYIGTGEIIAYLLPVLPVAISGADLSCLFAVFFLEVFLAILSCPVEMACYRYAAAWTIACAVILAPAIIGTGLAAWFSAVESLRGEIDGGYILDVFALSGGASGIIADRIAIFRNRSLKGVLFQQHINRKYMFAHQPDKLIIPAWKSFFDCVFLCYCKLLMYILILIAAVLTGMFAKALAQQHVDFFFALSLAVGKLCFSFAVSWLISNSDVSCWTPEEHESFFVEHCGQKKIIVLRQPGSPSDNAQLGEKPKDSPRCPKKDQHSSGNTLSGKKPKGRITRGGWVAMK